MLIAAIAVFGAAGALARYGLDGLVTRHTPQSFPWGTLAVNVAGAFLLGLLVTAATERAGIPAWLRQSLGIGLLGAFTTFSTLSLETYRLIENREPLLAFANAAGSLVLGLAAVLGGIHAGRALL